MSVPPATESADGAGSPAQQDPPAQQEPAAEGEPTDEAVVAMAHRMLDLARTGQAGELLAYVDAGLPVNLSSPSGDTLLMLAAYHGHAALVTELAARGADPDRANDRGQTPLAGAVFKKEPEVLRALLDAGADPGAGTPSARETARFFELDDVVRLLESSPPKG